MIAGKVDKVTGKALSANDFTDALLTKLNGIATGATAVAVSNTLAGTSTTNALSALQGKVLNESKMDLPVESTDEDTAITASTTDEDVFYWWEE